MGKNNLIEWVSSLIPLESRTPIRIISNDEQSSILCYLFPNIRNSTAYEHIEYLKSFSQQQNKSELSLRRFIQSFTLTPDECNTICYNQYLGVN